MPENRNAGNSPRLPAGAYEVKVAVIENTTEVERKVRLVVQAGTENWNLTVYQLEKGVLEINEKEFIALYNHTSLKVPYRSNGTLIVTFSEGVDWINYSLPDNIGIVHSQS